MPHNPELPFGQLPGQGSAVLINLENNSGNTVKISNYGATITSIQFDGAEMVLGYDSLTAYLGDQPYFGALIGRYGNRISAASFQLDGQQYDLVANEGPHQLHGGTVGFDKQLWEVLDSTSGKDYSTLLLRHVSPDGHMGYPGTLTATCRYTWTDDNELRIDYAATTDKSTVLNLTNHSYFTLGQHPDILSLQLVLCADQYTPVDKEMIPLGEVRSVDGTAFDFRQPKSLGQDINAHHPDLVLTKGYDHNLVLEEPGGQLRQFATLSDPATGRQLTCATTEPGVQLFTANFSPGQFRARDGSPLPRHAAVCLETQHFPDAPNQPAFPTPLVTPSAPYRSATTYHFQRLAKR